MGDSGDPAASAYRFPLEPEAKRFPLEPETPTSGESNPEKNEPRKLGELWPDTNTLPVDKMCYEQN